MTLMSELLEALRPEVHMAFFKQEMGAPPLMEHPFFRSALLRACETSEARAPRFQKQASQAADPVVQRGTDSSVRPSSLDVASRRWCLSSIRGMRSRATERRNTAFLLCSSEVFTVGEACSLMRASASFSTTPRLSI